jgi:hypothetical protein
VDRQRVIELRALLAGTGWVERTRAFARALRRAPHDVGGLLLVGPPENEPWHLAAHLTDEARLCGVPQLAPSLVRWSPPPDAPAHLSIGLERLEAAGRHDTLLIVAPDTAPANLLERAADARRAGATLFSVVGNDEELPELSHESLLVRADNGLVVPDFDTVCHFVSTAAGEEHGSRSRWRMLRDRLARALDLGAERDDEPDWALE